MTDACKIDGIDIATYGVIILRGGDHGFISFPSRKQPVVIDWPDQDGFEIGDNTPVYNEKKLTVNYYLKGNETNFQSRLNSFVSLHESSGYRAVEVREFGQTFQLRYAGVSSFSMNRGFTASGEKAARIGIDYVMDNPVQFGSTGSPTEPTANRSVATHVEISGVDLSAFGIVVQDVYSSAYRVPVKDRLVYSSAYRTGNIADTSYAPKRGKQDITIKCTMLCDDRTAFMENYSALFNKLNFNGFTLGLVADAKQYICYYSSMENFTKLHWTERAVAGFDLKLIGSPL